MKTLIKEGVMQNLKDNQTRYVFYSEGRWNLSFRLPSLVDFATFYVIEHGTSHSVCL